MYLTFLGTSAANAFPEAFCHCENCRGARALGGRSLRRRSAALIDDDLLIDLGPDIMTAAHVLRRPLIGVRFCLQTHAHTDHLDPSHLLSRSPGYGVVGAPPLHFYASAGTIRHTASLLARDCAPRGLLDTDVQQSLNLKIHIVEAYQTRMVGPYRVTAFPANHDTEVEPLLFSVATRRRAIFYGADTAALSEEVWQSFHRFSLRFDLVILDHTYGPEEPASDHLNARQCAEHAERFRREGLLADRARILATHIAHEGNPPHPELEAYALQHGYEVAYDGLVV